MANSNPSNNQQKPVTISQLLAAVSESNKWRSKLELHRVFEFWETAVGREIATVAQPSLIRGNTLWVKVRDSVWMQQLHLQKLLLLEKINKLLKDESFADMHFQLDSSLSPPQVHEEKKTKPVLIDKKKEQEFDRLISSLDNGDLKASLKSFWLRMQTKGK